MIEIAIAALLQLGSCQAASPDRTRTSAEAADVFLKGLEERDTAGMRWVVKPGALFEIGGETHSDEDFYASIATDRSPRKNLVIVGLTTTPTTVAATTAYRGAMQVQTTLVFEFADGCITSVEVHPHVAQGANF